MGLGNPCSSQDRDLFAAATKVAIGNGKNALFWEAPWLDGLRPKDLAPLIYDRSNKKKSTVKKALENNFWVAQINTHDGLSLDHIEQFYRLWEKLAHVTLDEQTPDKIIWKLTKDGSYSTKSAYKMQFLGSQTPLCPLWFGVLGLRQSARSLLS